jgi:glycerol-3-phosphate O-acyltransferase 3/4
MICEWYFVMPELRYWNLLTRTHHYDRHLGWELIFYWVVGVLFRYFILVPMRLILATLAFLWLMLSMFLIGVIPFLRKQLKWQNFCQRVFFRTFARALSATITVHYKENRAKEGLCVANHTSPIDVMILATDNDFSLVGL